MRAIEVSHTACKDEFRRNLRSHSWSVFSFFIINISLSVVINFFLFSAVILLCTHTSINCFFLVVFSSCSLVRRSRGPITTSNYGMTSFCVFRLLSYLIYFVLLVAV